MGFKFLRASVINLLHNRSSSVRENVLHQDGSKTLTLTSFNNAESFKSNQVVTPLMSSGDIRPCLTLHFWFRCKRSAKIIGVRFGKCCREISVRGSRPSRGPLWNQQIPQTTERWQHWSIKEKGECICHCCPEHFIKRICNCSHLQSKNFSGS